MEPWVNFALLVSEIGLFFLLTKIGSRQTFKAVLKGERSPSDPWPYWMAMAQSGWMVLLGCGLIWINGQGWTEADRSVMVRTALAGAGITALLLCLKARAVGRRHSGIERRSEVEGGARWQ